jgi:ribosomal protein S18 acetylase RimI-like enzyme
MPIEIRILQIEDAYILDRVATDVFDDPLLPRAVQEFLGSPDHHLAVAIDEGQVVGFASAVQYVHPDKPRPELWVNEVGVSSSHQRQGVGKALMHALLEVARDAGCSEAWVLTERNNQPAMSLYRSVGGEEEPEETVMFSFKLETNTSED